MTQYTALFRNRSFLFHWIAGAISNVGDFFNSLALVKILSEDPEHLGVYMSLIMVAKMLPNVILGPVAGALADRLPRRAIMVAADLVRALLVGALVFTESPAVMIALVFGAAIASAFFTPASSAMLPSLVKPEQLVTAGSLGVMTQRIAMLLGNSLGAVVLIAVGPHNVFYIDAASFAISALLLLFIQAPPVVREVAPPRSAWDTFVSDMRETVAFVREVPVVGHLFATLALAAAGDAALNVLMVPFFTVTLGVAAEMMGFAMALFGAASVVGALLIGAIGGRIHWRHLLSFGITYVWVTMVGAMVTSSLWLSTAFLVLLGLGSGAINVGLQAAVGQLVTDQVRGRVFGGWSTIASLIFVIGGVAAGALADAMNPALVILLFATGYLAAGVYAFIAFRSVGASGSVSPTASD